VISVIVPAHNEAAVIGRLLSGLLAEATPGEFAVVVVANGCTDGTAAVAASFGPDVTVVETPEPSKHRAMRLGDAHTDAFPRLYVDADVELRTRDARALAVALDDMNVLAVAPVRETPLAGRPWAVRWYYDVWERLPVVTEGLFGRGVVGVSRLGHTRLAELPELMGDDLAASLSFAPHERRVVADARVVVHPPRSYSDLIRRRVRSTTVIAQVAGGTTLAGARTTRADLWRLLRDNPATAPHVMWFLSVTVVARVRARRAVRTGDYTTWLRDESSRGGTVPSSSGS
jgi:glycosyltransferase involved in cell wall biosynthesis